MRGILVRNTNGFLTAVGSICLGMYLEKWRSTFFTQQVLLEKMPALPIFGTVSAAVPMAIDDYNVHTNMNRNDRIALRTRQIMKYGFPSLENIRTYQDLVLSYDQRNRVPCWVFEHLTKESVSKNSVIDRSKCDFKEDPSFHEYFRATNQDYKHSGYDRGHMAAAGNHRLHQEHVQETFLLSNIAPQVGIGFNRDIWNDLEKYVRKLARIHKNVYVCTGPLYLPRNETDGKMYVKYQVLGVRHVAVPTHFFKIVVMESETDDLEMEAYVLPNRVIEKGTNLHSFQVSPESIERASGLLFFDRLSKNKLRRINNKKI